MNQQPDLLDDSLIKSKQTRRIKLLPIWIKVFCWIFIVFACVASFGFIYGLFGNDFDLSLYGFKTSDTTSVLGIGLVLMFLLKGVVAFGLLKEQNWAIKLGFVDAIVGILACVFVMIYPLIDAGSFTFRLELIILIPYLIKLDKIKEEWEAVEVD